jgi:hypothetical protein
LVRGSEWSIIAFAVMVRAKAMASVMSRYIIDQKSRDDIPGCSHPLILH